MERQSRFVNRLLFTVPDYAKQIELAATLRKKSMIMVLCEIPAQPSAKSAGPASGYGIFQQTGLEEEPFYESPTICLGGCDDPVLHPAQVITSATDGERRRTRYCHRSTDRGSPIAEHWPAAATNPASMIALAENSGAERTKIGQFQNRDPLFLERNLTRRHSRL